MLVFPDATSASIAVWSTSWLLLSPASTRAALEKETTAAAALVRSSCASKFLAAVFRLAISAPIDPDRSKMRTRSIGAQQRGDKGGGAGGAGGKGGVGGG